MQAVEIQQCGIEDDGTPGGRARVTPTRGNAVPVPLRQGGYAAQVAGSATADYQQVGVNENSDGSSTGLAIAVPAGINNGVRVWMPFHGPVFGLRWRHNFGEPSYVPFSAEIDGRPFTVSPRDDYAFAEGLGLTIERREILADDLGHGRHMASVFVTGDPAASGAITRRLLLLGTLQDAGSGAVTPPPASTPIGTTTLTTSAAAIVASNQSYFLAVSEVWYTNLTSSDVTVTVEVASGQRRKITVPANGDAVLTFPGGRAAVGSTWTHKASAGSAVNATVFGVR